MKPYKEITRGTYEEDAKIIFQDFKLCKKNSMFTFLNFYNELPVSFDGCLVNIDDNAMEFNVHEYQAKLIFKEKTTIIRKKYSFRDDIIGYATYANTTKKTIILTRFQYAKIYSDDRDCVRIDINNYNCYLNLNTSEGIITGKIKNISVSGCCVLIKRKNDISVNDIIETQIILNENEHIMINLFATIVKLQELETHFECFVTFSHNQTSNETLSSYINKLQITLIKELKELF